MSLFRNSLKVSSEKTTPKPKLSSGLLRSYTVISQSGRAFFVNIEKYNPPGPPPIIVIFMLSLRGKKQSYPHFIFLLNTVFSNFHKLLKLNFEFDF